MKKLILLLALLMPAALFAQTVPTAVTGTITDPNSVPYFPATVTACLTPVTTDPVVNGQHVNSRPGTNYCVPSASTNTAGAFQLQLYPNGNITPAATQWQFTVSTLGSAQPAGKGAQTFQVNITISGSSQDVGATLSAAAPVLLNSGSGSGVPSNSYYLQTGSCGTATNCTQIKGDGQYVVDATSNSTTTITCPNNDCNFTQADVGKKVWATTQGSGAGIGLLIYTTYVCPVTTITAVNSAQSITVGTTCTASGTANVVLVWGTDDGPTLHGLDAIVGCSAVILPTNKFILTSQSFLITQPTCATRSNGLTSTIGVPQPGLFGQGSSTIFIITPDFAYAGCTGTGAVSGGVCIGSGLSQISGFSVWGTGLTSASNANCANGNNKVIMAASATGGAIYFMDMAGVCPGATGMVGVELNSLDEQFKEGGVQSVGSTAVVVSQVGVNTESTDCRNDNVAGGLGMSILSTGQLNDSGSFPIVVLNNAGTFLGRGSHLQGTGGTAAVTVTGTGRHYDIGDFYDAGSNGLVVQAGGYASAKDTKFTNGTLAVNTSAGSTAIFFDGGGNTIPSFSGLYVGLSTLQGKLTNTQVANRNSTLTSTTLIPAAATFSGAAVPVVTVKLYAMDATPLGSSCTGNTTVTWTISYTDAGGAAKTQTAVETITTNGVAGADVLQTEFQLYMQNNTAVTYSTVVAGGTGCSPVPSYTAELSVN